MVTYSEVESLVKVLQFTAESPRRCIEALKPIERRIMDEGADNPNLLNAVRAMQNYCVSEIMDGRREMLTWLRDNFDTIQKRKLAKERAEKRGEINMLDF